MKVGELKAMLADMPDDAIVYVEADHSQSAEQAGWFSMSDDIDTPYNGEEMEWSEDNEMNPLDVTAVIIGA